MYNSFFKLQSSPFGTSPDPRFLYMMPHTREALATLEYGISAHKGFIGFGQALATGIYKKYHLDVTIRQGGFSARLVLPRRARHGSFVVIASTE